MADISIEAYIDESQIDFIMELMKNTLSEPYSIYTYRYFLRNWPDLCFFAKDNTTGKYIGCCIGKVSKQNDVQQGYLAMLSIDKAYRRMGIATKLSLHLFEEMINKKCDKIVLETEADNESALALYLKLGFVKEQKLLCYYMNGGDAYQLTLPLTDDGISKVLTTTVDED